MSVIRSVVLDKLSKDKTVIIKDFLIEQNVRNHVLGKGINSIVYKQVAKDDKQNKESFMTIFADSKEAIEKELQRFSILSDRVRKSRLDEINSIPKYHSYSTKIRRV